MVPTVQIGEEIYHSLEYLESVRENETHKILWDFEIQTDHRTPTSSSVNYQKYRNCSFSLFCYSSGTPSENKRKRKYN